MVPSSLSAQEKVPSNLSNEVKIFNSLDEFLGALENFEIDFVINLTPSNLHFSQGKKILNRGLNLIIEKPISLTLEESQELCQIAKSNNLKLYTIQNYSSFVMVMALKRFLEKNSIGQILHVYGRMLQQGYLRNVNGNIAKIQDWRLVDQGIPMVMHDLGSHLIHLIGFLTKNYPKKVVSNFNNSTVLVNTISSCEILGVDENKVSYNLSMGKSYLGNQNSFQIEIFGSLGSLKWELQNSEFLEYTKEDGVKISLDRQWAESQFPELLIFSRFKPGHSAGFVEALANYYTILKYDFEKNPELAKFLTPLDEVNNYLGVMEACVLSVKYNSWH